MAMATWSEIKELATQLKQTQDKRCAFHLSERTWVDIVKHLTSSQRLKLIYTCDGRSYLTRNELDKEIREEVEAHSGRITLTELASNLDIDPLLIETRVTELSSDDAKENPTDRLICVPAEVLNSSYVRQVAQDIQDRLEEKGQISVGELATIFSLPTAFLLNIVNDYQGKLFKVQKYGDQYFTEHYMNEKRARVRGYFSCVIRPVTLISVATKIQVPETLLPGIVSSLISSGQLSGSLIAARGTYVPTCYTRAEDTYIQLFYSQNGYIDWNYLKRMGISDPVSYLKSHFPDAIHLSKTSISMVIADQLKDTFDEVSRDSNWADLRDCIPVSLDDKERVKFASAFIQQLPLKITDGATHVIADKFISDCKPVFEKSLLRSAELAARELRKLQVTGSSNISIDRDELQPQPGKRTIQSHNKCGFGVGSREVKTKNVKKKYNPSKRRAVSGTHSDSDDAESKHTSHGAKMNPITMFNKYLPIDDLAHILTSNGYENTPDEVVNGVISHLFPDLEKNFANLVNSMLGPTSDSAVGREQLSKTQDAVNGMAFGIQLMERGIMMIDQQRLQEQLLRYLMKQHATCLVDRLCLHLAKFYGIDWPSSPSSDSSCQNDSFIMVDDQNKQTDWNCSEPLSHAERHKLFELLQGLGQPAVFQAASALNRLLESLKSFQPGPDSLANYFALLDNLTTYHMGITLSTLHSRLDNKRKREERIKANELALQMEQEILQTMSRMTTDIQLLIPDVASILLNCSCLLTQVLVGWPVAVPGKCVPDLVTWIRQTLLSKCESQNESKEKSTTALSALISSSSSVIEDLSVLANLVAQKMRSDGEPLDVVDAASATFSCQRLIDTSKLCRKLLYN